MDADGTQTGVVEAMPTNPPTPEPVASQKRGIVDVLKDVGAVAAWLAGFSVVGGTIWQFAQLDQKVKHLEASQAALSEKVDALPDDVSKAVAEKLNPRWEHYDREIRRLREHAKLPAGDTAPLSEEAPQAHTETEEADPAPATGAGVRLRATSTPACVDMEYLTHIACRDAEQCFEPSSFSDKERARVSKKLGLTLFTPCYSTIPDRIKGKIIATPQGG